jgi:hypothetical protein
MRMGQLVPSTLKASSGNPSGPNLRLIVGKDLLPVFYRLLAQGFVVNSRGNISIRDLLCQQFGISELYLEERIQTIFLDGKAVDNANSTIVKDGSTLALSAAMPGLVGAMFRKGGYYSKMRAEISHPKENITGNEKAGKLTLKLFNLTAKEIGPIFLEQGILIFGSELENILTNCRNDFQSGCQLVEINNKKLSVEKLFQIDWQKKTVFLRVKTS